MAIRGPGSEARRDVALVAMFALPRLLLMAPMALETLDRSPGHIHYPAASNVISVVLAGLTIVLMTAALPLYRTLRRPA